MRGSVEAMGGERWGFISNVSGKTGERCSLYNADKGSNPEAHGRSPCNVPPANEAHHPTQHHPAEPLSAWDALFRACILAAILSDLRRGTASLLATGADSIGTG